MSAYYWTEAILLLLYFSQLEVYFTFHRLAALYIIYVYIGVIIYKLTFIYMNDPQNLHTAPSIYFISLVYSFSKT